MIGTTEIVRSFGIPLRHLQWLDECGYVTPLKWNHRREYTAEQLRLILLIRRLREKKIPLQRIVPLLPGLRHTLAAFPDCKEFLACGKKGLSETGAICWQAVGKIQVLATHSKDELLRLAAKHRGWFFVVEI